MGPNLSLSTPKPKEYDPDHILLPKTISVAAFGPSTLNRLSSPKKQLIRVHLDI